MSAALAKSSPTRRNVIAASLAAACTGAVPRRAAAGQSPSWMIHLTASQAAARIRRGKLSAERYVAALIAQSDLINSLNMFISRDDSSLLRGAREIDRLRAAGYRLGAMAGIPLLVKDNINAVGLPATAGTPALVRNQPVQNAPLLAQLFRANALLFGKMNMDELAFGVTSDNPTYGAVHNPYAFGRIPGGSSGGTAAGIAARVSPVGLGTDTAGSGRGPASLCGVVGFRPSIGRYPAGGTVPTSHTRDVIAPLGRTVADVVLIDYALTGRPIRRDLPLSGLRLGVPRSSFWNNLEPETEAVANEALGYLRAAGVMLVDVELPGLADLVTKNSIILAYEAINDLAAYLTTTSLSITVQDVIAQIATPIVAASYQSFLGASTDTQDYNTALTVYRPQLQELYANCFSQNGVQALCFPPTPSTAPPIGQQTLVLDGVEVPVLNSFIENLNPGASSGQPGLVVPAGLSRSGLPVGLEFDGPIGSDDDLLAIGLAAEKVFPPVSRRDCDGDRDCGPPGWRRG